MSLCSIRLTPATRTPIRDFSANWRRKWATCPLTLNGCVRVTSIRLIRRLRLLLRKCWIILRHSVGRESTISGKTQLPSLIRRSLRGNGFPDMERSLTHTCSRSPWAMRGNLRRSIDRSRYVRCMEQGLKTLSSSGPNLNSQFAGHNGLTGSIKICLTF